MTPFDISEASEWLRWMMKYYGAKEWRPVANSPEAEILVNGKWIKVQR
jgi:hypothetical protein